VVEVGPPDLQAHTSFRRGPRWLLPAIVSVTIAAIVFGFAVSLYPTPHILRDALGYTMTAQRLVRHHFFSFTTAPPSQTTDPTPPSRQGTSSSSPASTSLAEPLADTTATVRNAHGLVREVQLVLSLLAVAFIAGCGYSIGGRKLSYVAGILAAFYVPIGWSTTVALSECLALTLLAVCCSWRLPLVNPNARHRMALALGLGVSRRR